MSLSKTSYLPDSHKYMERNFCHQFPVDPYIVDTKIKKKKMVKNYITE